MHKQFQHAGGAVQDRRGGHAKRDRPLQQCSVPEVDRGDGVEDALAPIKQAIARREPPSKPADHAVLQAALCQRFVEQWEPPMLHNMYARRLEPSPLAAARRLTLTAALARRRRAQPKGGLRVLGSRAATILPRPELPAQWCRALPGVGRPEACFV